MALPHSVSAVLHCAAISGAVLLINSFHGNAADQRQCSCLFVVLCLHKLLCMCASMFAGRKRKFIVCIPHIFIFAVQCLRFSLPPFLFSLKYDNSAVLFIFFFTVNSIFVKQISFPTKFEEMYHLTKVFKLSTPPPPRATSQTVNFLNVYFLFQMSAASISVGQ